MNHAQRRILEELAAIKRLRGRRLTVSGALKVIAAVGLILAGYACIQAIHDSALWPDVERAASEAP